MNGSRTIPALALLTMFHKVTRLALQDNIPAVAAYAQLDDRPILSVSVPRPELRRFVVMHRATQLHDFVWLDIPIRQLHFIIAHLERISDVDADLKITIVRNSPSLGRVDDRVGNAALGEHA